MSTVAPGPASAVRTTIAGSSALSTAVLPYFLIGALSVTIQRELGITETAIGALGTVLFLSASVTATPAGRLVERVGSGVSLRIGVVLCGVAAAVIGMLANRWWQVALPMVAVGFGMAMIDTGAARAFADRVRSERQGVAFGIKEASIPTASMLAGLSLPTVAALLGWRATFVAALGVALLVLLVVPSPRALRRTGDDPVAGVPPARVASAGVVRFAAGVGLGTGAATASATFLVPAMVDRGMTGGAAGIVLAVASLAGVGMRVAMGWLADREGARPVLVLAALLGAGAAGAAILAVDVPAVLRVLGAVVVIGAGWGWTGLAFLAVVRANPDAPAAAAGVVLTGLGAGGALGPLAFGTVADRVSFGGAWMLVAVVLAVAAVTVRTARGHLEVGPVDTGRGD